MFFMVLRMKKVFEDLLIDKLEGNNVMLCVNKNFRCITYEIRIVYCLDVGTSSWCLWVLFVVNGDVIESWGIM